MEASLQLRALLWAPAFAAACSSGLQGQAPTRPAPGSRVRIVATGISSPYVGTLVAIAPDTLALQPAHGADTLHIAIARITRLDVSRGWTSHTRAGIRYGVVLGALTGAAVAITKCEGGSCKPETLDLTPAAAVLGAALGAGAGAIVGGLLGAASSGDRWEQVPPSLWRVGLLRVGGGRLAFGASLPL